ncbi:MAG: hypothetical protein O9972_13025 [Burkholderiales bacterium]|nr:hypothetical protein [Burkholderiales bacterium]
MLNIVLAALPILGKLIPQGRTGELIEAGTRVAQEVFGSTKESEIEAKIAADPALAEQFKARLAAETEAMQIESRNYELQVQDAANARAENIRLVETGSPIAWSGPVVDTVVVLGFFGTLFMLLARPVNLSPEMLTLLTTMVGFLGNNFAQIVNYHRGSSAGSALKDRMIQNINTKNASAAATVAAQVVEAAKVAVRR